MTLRIWFHKNRIYLRKTGFNLKKKSWICRKTGFTQKNRIHLQKNLEKQDSFQKQVFYIFLLFQTKRKEKNRISTNPLTRLENSLTLWCHTDRTRCKVPTNFIGMLLNQTSNLLKMTSIEKFSRFVDWLSMSNDF